MQRISILGSTGSIGTQTLAVISLHMAQFEVFALSGYHNIDLLAQQCKQFKPVFAVVSDEAHANKLAEMCQAEKLSTEVLFGQQALNQIACEASVDIVMSAIVGAAGLAPTYHAVKAGKKVLLANKESLLLGGKLVMETAAQTGAQIIPVDSEHNAIFQCLPHQGSRAITEDLASITLTASGGPFWQHSADDLKQVTPQDALTHPNWNMGNKISIDSATMMNKAFEVIEAYWLFKLSPGQIKVVVHPQSIIHSIVSFKDSSMLAQLGSPDMRIPISHALFYPERAKSGVTLLDLTEIGRFDFYQSDHNRFPSLQLSYDILAHDPQKAAILNAANEQAVLAFLNNNISFLQIYQVCVQCLAMIDSKQLTTLEALYELDARTRALAKQHIQSLS